MNKLILDRVIKEFSLQDLADDKRQQLAERLFAVLQDRVVLSALPRLQSQDQDEFATMLAQNSEYDVFDFLRQKLPEFDQLVAQCFGALKQDHATLSGV